MVFVDEIGGGVFVFGDQAAAEVDVANAPTGEAWADPPFGGDVTAEAVEIFGGGGASVFADAAACGVVNVAGGGGGASAGSAINLD